MANNFVILYRQRSFAAAFITLSQTAQDNETSPKVHKLLIHQPQKMHFIEFMTSINLLHVSALGCHLQGIFQNKVIQAQQANRTNHTDALVLKGLEPAIAC
jgi:hypothetical protein